MARPLSTTLLASLLVMSLVSFTVIYRNSHTYCAANATRCYSLSSDHASVGSLFAGEWGPLTSLGHSLVLAPPPPPTGASALVEPPAGAPVFALTTSPWRRPPPIVA